MKDKEEKDWCELDFKRRNKITKLKDRIAELESELEKEQINNLNCDTELQYKEKRIAELEKENGELNERLTVFDPISAFADNYAKGVKEAEKVVAEALKQFAERLKEKFYYVFGNEYEQSVSGFDTKVLIEHIDETLKEFIDG